jgi:mono/diheme cytochrome c family protein
MRKLCTLLSAIAVVGLIGGNWTTGVRAHARETGPGSPSSPDLAGRAERRPQPRVQPQWLRPVSSRFQPQAAGNAGAASPSAALFKQYCVGCHNDRMKGNFGNLSLDNIDPADVSGHVETFEKVVRKLRKGLMPPEGRPRPDAATLDAFTTSLETALDRAAEQQPNPGRVVSRRLNRTEYVNAIHDLLGLEVNGAELLPSDMAGFGFDNNADVLSITPGLMARYITAATKISRVALATPDNRPATIQYKVEIGTLQDARMGEDMPFATFGGLGVKHTFPLDGEYAFQLRLTRDQDGIINGIMAEHQI